MRYSSKHGCLPFHGARAIRKSTTVVPTQRGMLTVGFSGGVLDAVGGGG